MTAKLTPVAPALSNGIVQGQAFGLSTAPQLPESANALPQALQAKARAYIGAQRQTGESLYAAVQALSEARALAEDGQWFIFLQAIGLDESRARAQIRIYEECQANPLVEQRLRSGFLSEAAARVLLAAPPEVKQEVLLREEPPTVKDVRAARRDSSPAEIIDQRAADPPDHLAAAGYHWLPSNGAIFIIADPHGWQGNAPTAALALSLAEDRYAARLPSPQETRWTVADDDDDDDTDTIDDSGVFESYTPPAAPERLPADWRTAKTLQLAMGRFNDAIRGNDRGAALRAVRAVVIALEEED